MAALADVWLNGNRNTFLRSTIMARALISTNEHVYTTSGTGETRYRLNPDTGEIQSYKFYPLVIIPNAARIVQVVADYSDEFAVALPLFWVHCPSTIAPDQYFYDMVTGNIDPIPHVNQ